MADTPYLDIVVRRRDGDMHPLLHFACSVSDVFAYMDAIRFMQRCNQPVLMVVEPINLDEFNTTSYVETIRKSYNPNDY